MGRQLDQGHPLSRLRPGVTERIDPELAKNLPTYPDNVKTAFFTDWAFWVKNREKLEARWKEWLLN